MEHLKQLKISGSGTISSKSEFTTENKLVIGISGSGSIDVVADAPEVDLDISGSAKVFVTKTLDVKIAGSGDVYYKGHPSINVNIAGSGNVINAN